MITLLLAGIALHHGVASEGLFVRTIDRTDGVSVSQTEAKRLTSPGKPDIWLVGVAHIGSKAYYGQIQTLLDAQDKVLFEGVRPKNGPLKPPSEDPKAPKMIYQVFGDALGLDFQLSDINYDNPNWINSDLSLEKLQALGQESGKAGKKNGITAITNMLAPGSSEAKTLTSFMQSATPSMKEALKIFLIEKLAKIDVMLPALADPATVKILIHDRNQSVEQHLQQLLDAQPQPKSIAIFYGAAHQPEIQEDLEQKYGYKYAEQLWFTYASADRKKLDAAGKMMLDQMMSSFPG